MYTLAVIYILIVVAMFAYLDYHFKNEVPLGAIIITSILWPLYILAVIILYLFLGTKRKENFIDLN